jgi:hypothetical protein
VADIESWMHVRVVNEMNRLINVLKAEDVAQKHALLTTPQSRAFAEGRKNASAECRKD